VDTVVEGIGINRVVTNFELALPIIDDAFRITDPEAVSMARFLVEKDGLFVGSSSACNLVAAVRYVKKWGGGTVRPSLRSSATPGTDIIQSFGMTNTSATRASRTTPRSSKTYFNNRSQRPSPHQGRRRTVDQAGRDRVGQGKYYVEVRIAIKYSINPSSLYCADTNTYCARVCVRDCWEHCPSSTGRA